MWMTIFGNIKTRNSMKNNKQDEHEDHAQENKCL